MDRIAKTPSTCRRLPTRPARRLGLDPTDNYAQSRLREVTPNGGAVSLDIAELPCNVPGSAHSETRSSTH